MKLPAFQFYPGDWQKDPDLRRCSHAAKGVLIDALCLMFESGERGVLVSGNCAWSEKDLAAAVGGNMDVTLGSIRELLEKGVLKRRSPDGAIYSSRMVNDEKLRAIRKKCGKMGGNPILVNQILTTHLNQNPTTGVNQIPEDEDEDEDEEGTLKGGAGGAGGAGGGDPDPNHYPLRQPAAAPNDEQWTKCYGLARTVLAKLNALTGSRFSEGGDCMEPIAARLFETAYDLPGCLQMIERQVKLWSDDPRTSQGLTPKKLFGENFQNYYGQREKPIPVATGKPQHNRNSGVTNDLNAQSKNIAAAVAAAQKARMEK